MALPSFVRLRVYQLMLIFFCSQSPPGSTQLTRVYTAFAEANGRVLDVDAILKDINDPTDSYNHTNVELLVDLLVRKRFIKRGRNGWRLRV